MLENWLQIGIRWILTHEWCFVCVYRTRTRIHKGEWMGDEVRAIEKRKIKMMYDVSSDIDFIKNIECLVRAYNTKWLYVSSIRTFVAAHMYVIRGKYHLFNFPFAPSRILFCCPFSNQTHFQLTHRVSVLFPMSVCKGKGSPHNPKTTTGCVFYDTTNEVCCREQVNEFMLLST